MDTQIPPLIEIICFLLLWLAATGLTHRLRRPQRRESSRRVAPSSLLGVFAHVSRPLAVLALTFLAVRASAMHPLGLHWLETRAAHLEAWRVFWMALAAVGLVDGLAHAYFHRQERHFPIPDLLLDILRLFVVAAVGLLVLRFELGIDIGPLLASTALLTAVIGFALQGVLGNLLAGMSLHLVRALRPGVWVTIGDLEGRVVMTNWRETRLRTRGGHYYIVPNGQVAEARIHNFSEPTSMRTHAVNVGASYSDAPDEVIEALCAAARDVPDVRSSPEPFAVVTEFQDYGINYRLLYWSTAYERRIIIDGEVKRRIWYHFKRRGIEIPFPMSDKLLNDFMAVVYKQRKLPPTDQDLATTIADLSRSDLVRKLVVDSEGHALLGEEELTKIAPLVQRLPFTHGETLCTQGDLDETFWVVASGKLRGEVEKEGEIVVSFEFDPGAVLGEMGALTGMPRSASIKVLESSQLLHFGPAAFRQLLMLHEAIPERLAELAAERSAQNREAFEELARQKSVDTTVAFEREGILKRLMRMIGGQVS